MQFKFIRFGLIISLLTSSEAKLRTNFPDPLKNQEIKSELESESNINNKKLREISSLKSHEQKVEEGFERLGVIQMNKRNFYNLKDKSKKNAKQIKAIREHDKPSSRDPKKNKRKKSTCSRSGLCSNSKLSENKSFKKVRRNLKRKTRDSTSKENSPSKHSKIRKARRTKIRENMLEKVMKTTTKDPNKQKSGDPGMEYSEYYNDDDLNDSPAGEREKDNFKVRSERQVPNEKFNEKSKSSYNPEDKDTLDKNEPKALLNDSNQNNNRIYPKVTNQQQNLIYDPRLAYGPNSFFRSDPQKSGQLVRQPVEYIYPQYFYPNQYINPNQVLPLLNKPLNLGNNEINFNTKREATSSNSTTLQSTIQTEVCASIAVSNCSSPNSLSSQDDFSKKSEENDTLSTPLSKKELRKNARPIHSLVPFINHENEQQPSNVSSRDIPVIANQILSKIVDELEDLKAIQIKQSQKEGYPCRLTGSWESNQAGVKLNIKVAEHSLAITAEKLKSPKHDEGILNTTWNITGQRPFKNGGPFFLSAVNNRSKSLAVFVGSCRICQGIDTIEGIWTVVHNPEDCQDFQTATRIYNDIFRRANYHKSERKIRKTWTN